jgi:ribonuclease P protein component
MISNAHRFHGRSSLRFVYQRGQMVRGTKVSLRYVRNERQKAYRLAVVVSRKVSKSAVVRNRVRRRLYEIVRKHSKQIVGPYDLVLTVYDEQVATTGHAGLQKDLLQLLARAGALQGTVSDSRHGTIQNVLTNSGPGFHSPEQKPKRKGENLSGVPPQSSNKETNT